MAEEWRPTVPPCARCGLARWRVGYTRLDDGGWVCDGCLTDGQRAAWAKEDAPAKGRVDIPAEDK